MDLFADDYRRNSEKYVAGRLPDLPDLPVPDDSVDVCLTANFLFAYPELLSARQHADALLELSRIARQQVRVHPIEDRGGRDISKMADEVKVSLIAAGCAVMIVTPEASWLRNARTMLIEK